MTAGRGDTLGNLPGVDRGPENGRSACGTVDCRVQQARVVSSALKDEGDMSGESTVDSRDHPYDERRKNGVSAADDPTS